ncbi:MAG TPA: electron transfer flavoprotein subunit beta/FixA family protein [bacterium]|nr:electron transfer flavoprotein subunit beta/FixA family protein [bacterium]
MNIVVCVKQVPSTETKIRVNTSTGFVDTTEIEWVVNPYDEYAMETALRLKEKAGAGTITVVALGPERVKTALRTTLAMGADAAVQLTDPAFDGIDALAVGRLLAAAVKRQPFDIVFCGKQAVDDDFAAVPPAIAHFLGIPHVSVVAEVTADTTARTIVARREIEGATEVVQAPIPCLVTIQKGAYEPRYPTLKGMMAAKKKEIPVLGATVLGIDSAALTRRVIYVDDRLPPGRKPGRVLEGAAEEVVPELVRLLREEAKVI